MSHAAAAGLPLAAAQPPPALQQPQQQQQHLEPHPPVSAAASQPVLHPAATTAHAAPQPLAAATSVVIPRAAASLPPPPAAVPAAATAAAAATPSAAASAADSRFDKCGFAKLLGDNGLEYYIKKYEITLGRKSKASNIDVVLGDSPVLSRQHARIVYAFDAKRWELHVEGKNGITVNGTLHTPTTGPCVLNSQDLLQAGDHNFYFLLPKQQRKRAPKSSKVATPAGSEGAAVQQQQQQPGALQLPPASSLQQQQSVYSPRLGMPPLGEQQQTPAAALGPALDGPQLGGINASPILPGSVGYNGSSSGLNPLKLQDYNSGPLLPGLAQFGNGIAEYDGTQAREWGSEFSMDRGFNGGLGDDLGDEDPHQPDGMED